jgi:hypothetical protein
MTPAHFTFGWGYALLVGAGIQKKYCHDESKQVDALFSIHRRSRYCGKTRSNKILFKYGFLYRDQPDLPTGTLLRGSPHEEDTVVVSNCGSTSPAADQPEDQILDRTWTCPNH